MKNLVLIALVIATCFPIIIRAQDFSPLSGKVESIIKAQEPDWKLTIKRTKESPNVYKWESGAESVAVSLLYTASEAEAKAKLKDAKNSVSVPVTAQLKTLGDEAYLWKGGKRGFVLIQFRKSNVVAHVSARSESVAERWAEHIKYPCKILRHNEY